MLSLGALEAQVSQHWYIHLEKTLFALFKDKVGVFLISLIMCFLH